MLYGPHGAKKTHCSTGLTFQKEFEKAFHWRMFLKSIYKITSHLAMGMFHFPVTTTCVLMLGLTLASCAPTVAKRGNTIEDDQLQHIVVGQSTREDVAKALGTPTQMATFDDKTWYYIGQRTEKEAFFDPDLKEQKIVTVEFTPDGKVASVVKNGAELARNIDVVSARTPTYGKNLTIMQQLLGNIGRPSIPKGKEGK